MAVDPGELQFLERFTRHLTRRPKAPRPDDYGNQSPRLLAELTDSMRSDHEMQRGRTRLDVRGQLREMRESELGVALIGDMTGDADAVAPDQDVFGAGMVERASRRLRLTPGGRRAQADPKAIRMQAEHDASLAGAGAQLNRHWREQQAAREVAALQAEYPDLSAEDALLMAGAPDDDEGPVAA